MRGKGKAAPATPAELAEFGHIAARLRAFMKEREMIAPEVSQALGLGRKSATIYKWLSGKGAPAPTLRARLAKLLGCQESDLLARKDGTLPRSIIASTALKPSVIARPIAPRAGSVLSFNVTGDGEARLVLDVTLPIAQAMPLLRILLDAGIVVGEAKL